MSDVMDGVRGWMQCMAHEGWWGVAVAQTTGRLVA